MSYFVLKDEATYSTVQVCDATSAATCAGDGIIKNIGETF